MAFFDTYWYILLTLFCCFLYGASAVISKYALQKISAVKPQQRWYTRIIQILKNKYWLLGVLLSISANLIVFQLQSIVDLSFIYPILNYSYLFALLLGYIFFKEILTINEWLGIFVVSCGVALLISAPNHHTSQFTDFFKLNLVLIFSVLTCLSLILVAKFLSYTLAYAACAGLAFANASLLLKTSTYLVIAKLGFFSVYSWQAISSLFFVWPFWLLVFYYLLGFISMQLSYFNNKVSLSVLVITVIEPTIISYGGYLIFQEHINFTKLTGIVTIICGIIFVALNQHKSLLSITKQTH